MVILHSFLKKFSLRTGTTVSLILGLVFLIVTVVLGSRNNQGGFMFQTRTLLLAFMWLSFTMLAFYGVYVEVSTYLIPELSRRVLFLILDIMGVIANYFKSELEEGTVPLPDIGLQWYATFASNANTTLYYALVVVFIATIPIKAYFFVVVLSYYMFINMENATTAATSTPTDE